MRFSAARVVFVGMLGCAIAGELCIWAVRDRSAGHTTSLAGSEAMRRPYFNEHGAYKRPLSDPMVAHIHGRAVHVGHGVGGIGIDATVWPRGMGWTVDTVTTRPDGTFDLPVTSNHLVGRQLVTLYAGGPATGGSMLEISPGQVRDGVIIDVGAGFKIRGVVVDPSGSPIEGAFVQTDSLPLAMTGPTGKDGAFEIVLRTPGRYHLRVHLVGLDKLLPSLTHPLRSFDVVEPDGELDGVVLRVDPDPTVPGLVVDERGRPIVGATVQQLRTVTRTPVTDARGHFQWKPASHPPYVVSAKTADGRMGFAADIQLPRRELTIRVGPTGRVAVDCGAFPARSIDVSMVHYGAQLHCGEAVALPPGTYRVVGRARDDALAFATARVVAGHTTNVTLEPARQVKLRVRVRVLGEDAPKPEGSCDAEISLAAIAYYSIDSGWMGANGGTLQTPVGPIRISCDFPAFAPNPVDVIARDDQLVEITAVPIAMNGIDLGAELRTRADGALVIGAAEEAAAAGLRAGDVVVAVDDTSVVGFDARTVFELGFHIPPGHVVTWTVMRAGRRLQLHARAPGARTPPLYLRGMYWY